MSNSNPLSLLGTFTRRLVDGRIMLVLLTDYEASNSTYNGLAIGVGKSLDVGDPTLNMQPVQGIRVDEIVRPGEDESGLDDEAIAFVKEQEASVNVPTQEVESDNPNTVAAPPTQFPQPKPGDMNTVRDARDEERAAKEKKRKERG